jgi:hypothetical protein
MKRADIKVGETYGYTTYLRRGGDYANLYPLTVTGFEQKRVHNISTYGTRLATFAVGTKPDGGLISVEAKYLVEEYAPWKAREDKYAKLRAEAQTKQEQTEAERTPLVAALSERLAEAGYTSLRQYEHLQRDAIRKGKVEVPLQVLADLLGITVGA